MFITLVHAHVKEDCLADFVKACRLNHEASIREAGNCRFDVLQSADDVTRFVLYEAYVSAEDAGAHKRTAHYQAWRDTVAGMMAEPRLGVLYKGLFPAA